MAHLASLWATEREAHVEAFYTAMTAVEDASAREWEAAVLIQKVWRGYSSRCLIMTLREAVHKVEWAFKHWKVRKNTREKKIAALLSRRRTRYNGAATKLQALWRGYKSRTDIFDFSSRAEYLAERSSDCASMTRKMEDYREEVLAALAADREVKSKEAYMNRTRREHFLLSTSVQLGVYSTALGGPAPEVAEDDLRNSLPVLPPPAKRLSQSIRDAKRHTHWVIPHSSSPRKKVQGPFLPPDAVWEKRNRPANASLRMQTPYTYKEDAESAEKQTEWVARVIDAPFVPVSRRTRPLGKISEGQLKSVRAAEKFVDAPLLSPNAPVNRQVTYRRLDKIPLKQDFLSTTKSIPLCDEYSV